MVPASSESPSPPRFVKQLKAALEIRLDRLNQCTILDQGKPPKPKGSPWSTPDSSPSRIFEGR
jgi:hypothetical protein